MFRSTRKVSSRRSGRGKLQLFLTALPIVLNLLSQYRQRQKAKRGRFYTPSKRERLFDAVLDGANRRFGAGGRAKGTGRRRW